MLPARENYLKTFSLDYLMYRKINIGLELSLLFFSGADVGIHFLLSDNFFGYATLTKVSYLR